MVEGVYFFGERLRWNLGWPNPNPAGAWVACFIPFCWALVEVAITYLRRYRYLLIVPILIAEGLLWYLLCKTYSRGALVAILSAGGFVGMTSLFRHWRMGRLRRRESSAEEVLITPRQNPLRTWLGVGILRLCLIGFIVVSVGFFDRIDPTFVAQDDSAGNRLPLWKGGLQMIAAAPWTGWGVEESGAHYTQWFQPYDHTARYAGMVNSYLHVGVERGLPFLVAVLIPFALILFLGLIICGRAFSNWRSSLALAGLGSMIVFLVANVFSTLWIFPKLWWAPAIAAVVILLMAFARKYPVRSSFRLGTRTLAMGTVLAFGFGLVLLGIGNLIPSDLKITHGKYGVTLEKRGADGVEVRNVIALPDREVIGEAYGKALRQLVLESQGEFRLYVPFDTKEGMVPPDLSPKTILAMGKTVAEVNAWVNPSDELILIHPLGRPAEVWPEVETTLHLQTIMSGNLARVWRRIAKQNAWRIIENQGSGSDIRHLWPDCILTTIKRLNQPELTKR